MKHGNINTGEIVEMLPSVRISPEGVTIGAGPEAWAVDGWRTVTVVDRPDPGFRVTSYRVEEIDRKTCRLTVATSVNIKEEAAAIAAAQAAELARQLADTKALAKALYPGPGDIRNVTPEAVARLLMAECVVLYTWLFNIAPRVSGAPQKTAESVTAELYAAIDAQH